MANPQQAAIRPWFLELVPLMVVILIVAHVLALVSVYIRYIYLSNLTCVDVNLTSCSA